MSYDNDNYENEERENKPKNIRIINTKTGTEVYSISHAEKYKMWQETVEIEDRNGNLRTISKNRCQFVKDGQVTRIYLNNDVIVIATDEAE